MLVNPWTKFIIVKCIYGNNRKVIIDRNGNITNDNPSKEDLNGLYRYLTTTREIGKLPGKEKEEYLLELLRYFYRAEGRTPTEEDFNNNPRYPSRTTYWRIFGNWDNAIMKAELPINCGGKGGSDVYTDKELLEYLIKFLKENGKLPAARDLVNSLGYPSIGPYYNRFGSLQKALKLIGLDIDSMVRRGILETSDQKARLGELFIIDHFKEIGNIDLSGKDHNSYCDGICPKGYNYDVKTSGFRSERGSLTFKLQNVNIDEIEWFYLLAFNEDFTKLLYAWRIPIYELIEVIEKGYLLIGLTSRSKYTIEDMNMYEITEKIRPIFENWLDNIKKQDNSKESIVRNAEDMLTKYIGSKKNKCNKKLITIYHKRQYDGYIEEALL